MARIVAKHLNVEKLKMGRADRLEIEVDTLAPDVDGETDQIIIETTATGELRISLNGKTLRCCDGGR